MIKKIILLLFTIFSPNLFAQTNLWLETTADKTRFLTKVDRLTIPAEYKIYHLNFEAFKNIVALAPFETSMIESNVLITLPTSKGTLEHYRIYNAPAMEMSLQLKVPQIQTYVGKGIENPSSTVHFSTTLFGLHALTFTTDGSEFIDTYTSDLNNYIVYNKSTITPSRQFECLVNAEISSLEATPPTDLNKPSASDGVLRTFRLAMACTIEYAAFHVNQAGLQAGTIDQKKDAVLAAMVVTMNRVNGIYRKDMSQQMILIARNKEIIFIDSDNFDNASSNTLIGQSQTVIDGIIGFSNYDMGHTVSTGGGGLAGPSPCTGSKANGITGLPAPVGDPYDVDYVSHEMGHQFGANHTYNNSCGGNRNDGTAVEPGSGTTILAYAGICAPNVQNASDFHFSAISIAEMNARVASTANCAVQLINNNAPPVIAATPNYFIPRSTAFVLKANATDANNDALTYCWEQTNTNISTQPPVASSTGGPNFRSITPTTSGNRYMPVLSSVIAGSLTPTWEVVPSVARSMAFAVTVRDNGAANGGQTARSNCTVTTVLGAIFSVTSQNTSGIIYADGTTQTVSWSVAGTNTNANINTQLVNILLSTNGGLTFPTILAAATPNDGNQTVTIPNLPSTNCRIIVEAVGNIFYAVNSTPFAITGTFSNTAFAFDNLSIAPNPTNGEFTIQFTSPNSDAVKIYITDLRGRKIFENVFNNESLFIEKINLTTVEKGMYLVQIFNGDNKITKKIIIE